MDNELKDPFDTLKRNQYSYFEDLRFGVGSLLLIGGTVIAIGVIGFWIADSLAGLLA